MLTTSGTIISSCFEIGLLHLMATRRLRHYTDFWQYPAWSLFHLLLVPYYVVSPSLTPFPALVFGSWPLCILRKLDAVLLSLHILCKDGACASPRLCLMLFVAPSPLPSPVPGQEGPLCILHVQT